MATYYADLDLTGAGGDGSIGDPWHADTFQTITNGGLSSGDIVKVKGSHDYGVGAQIIGGIGTTLTIENWTSDPWRLKNSSFAVQNDSTIKNGIINCSIFSSTDGLYSNNCFIKADTNFLFWYSFSGKTFKIRGSTCITPLFDNGESCGSNLTDFLDSILDISTINYFDNAGSNNCVFSAAVIPGIGVHTNAQTGWTPPSWPSWDASQSAFSENLLYVGIAAPPQPGNAPYTGYEQGFWDSTRNGIGAMDFTSSGSTTTTTLAPTTTTTTLAPITSLSSFNVPSAGDNTSVTSSVNPSALVSLIQSVYPGDTYFDSTSEVGPVYVYYTHSAGRQQKRLVHDPVNHQASVQWSSYAQDGTWQKTKIKAFDKDGAFVYLDRSSIGTGEDLTHSDGTIYLNT